MNIVYGNTITPSELNNLRKLVGWTEIPERKIAIGLSNSLFTIVGRADGEAISVARVVGDGGYHLSVVDVIVNPKYQGMGIGRKMLNEILEYSDSITEEGESTMLILVAAKDKEPFYKQFGFIERPTPERGAGMYMYYEKGDKDKNGSQHIDM